MNDQTPKPQLTLMGILEALFWFAVVLGLARLYPETGRTITSMFRAIPLQCALTLCICVALGGMGGAMIGRRWFGIAMGAAAGGPLVLIGGTLRILWLAQASASV